MTMTLMTKWCLWCKMALIKIVRLGMQRSIRSEQKANVSLKKSRTSKKNLNQWIWKSKNCSISKKKTCVRVITSTWRRNSRNSAGSMRWTRGRTRHRSGYRWTRLIDWSEARRRTISRCRSSNGASLASSCVSSKSLRLSTWTSIVWGTC